MSALDKSLGVAAILLAGGTIYLAWRAGVERERAPPAPFMEMSTPAARPGTMRGAFDDGGPAAVPGIPADDPVTNSSAATPRGRGELAPREIADAISKRTLELGYKDSVTRRQLIEELVPDLRDEYLVLERRLKLGHARWQAFLEMMAAQTIDRRAQTVDCGQDVECQRRVISTSSFDQQDQMLRAMLGDADHREYKNFAYSLQERRGIGALQNRLLPPQRLSDDATEALITALGEVRRETEADISAVGGTVTSILFADVPTVILPLDLVGAKDRIEYVREYSQRMRERAATVLSGVQLARFDEQLDAMLVKMQRREEQMKPATPRG